MDKLFQSKWAIRVISLVFAVSLYLYVSIETNTVNSDSPVVPSPGASEEVQVLDDVPLEVRMDGDQYVVSGVPEYVTVSLEGKTRVLTPTVRQRNFKVFVDLHDFSEGEHTVDIEYEGIPEELTAFIEPKTIEVEIEKRASKEFPVEIDYVNLEELPLGYEIGTAEVNPETVTIISSESVIEQIAMVKVFIDASDLKESIRNREVPVSVYDIQGNDLNVKVDPAGVAISVPVERPSKTVSLSIATKGDLPDGFSLNKIDADNEIEIFGKREVLNEIDGISTKEIDLSEIDKSDTYDIELDFPEGIIANDDTIPVDIELDEEKVYKDIPIDIEGNDGENVTIVKPKDGKLDIGAIGSDQAMGKLTKSDIKALIDVKDLDSGKHDVDLEISGPDGITFDPDSAEITVEIE